MKVTGITKKAAGLLLSASFIATPALALAEGSSSYSSGGGLIVAPLLLVLLAAAYEHENRR